MLYKCHERSAYNDEEQYNKKGNNKLRNLKIEYLFFIVGDKHNGHFFVTLAQKSFPSFNEFS
jgi:hypothetical protein